MEFVARDHCLVCKYAAHVTVDQSIELLIGFTVACRKYVIICVFIMCFMKYCGESHKWREKTKSVKLLML